MNLFITTSDVCALAFPESGFYAPFVKNSLIEIAQITWLKPALGDEFYDQLLQEKAEGFSDSGQFLYDNYLMPALSWYAAWLTLPFAANKMNSLGAMDTFFDFKKFDGKDTGESARQAYLSVAESYRSELLDYLKKNSTRYPLYQPQNKSAKLIGGLVFGN